MMLMLLALLIILIVAGAGFAVHVLWWVAIAALIVWLIGFFVRRAYERDQNGQAGRGHGDGPGQPDGAADVVRLRGAPLPQFRADLGDAAVDVGAAQAEAERPGEGGLAPPGVRTRVA